ncbi:uncharacterized protein LOC129743944 [Uranotaenia lowii]|uniref:uncharacterized protein LOC129743944 n=1 Tax=Uranotaenia lowii TaxID=190385 RepID=UPI0024787A8B|nr:uncharacterized protein LOC129743944 [Uranotaenia lowii]
MVTSFDDLVTALDCADVVARSHPQFGAGKVLQFSLKQIPGQLGFLGEYARLAVTFEDVNGQQHDLRYFVKCLPFSDPKQRKIIQDFGIFAKEATGYRELFSRFNQDPQKVTKWRPDCWLMRDDLIIMEDLQIAGFLSMPYGQEFGKQHMMLIFDRMAQMHACSLDLEYNQLKGEKLEPKFAAALAENTFMRESVWFGVGLKGILTVAVEASKYSQNDVYRKIMQTEMVSKMDRIYNLVQPADSYQSVIIHRDLWFNNMMFRFAQSSSQDTVDYTKPLDCVLIDFQVSRYLPPAIDFLCTLHLLTMKHHRDELFHTYVEHYYQSLTEKLKNLNLSIVKILPKEQFLETLDHYRLVGLLWSGVLLAYVNLPDGYIADLHQRDPVAYHEFGLISRDKVILENIRKEGYFRTRLLDAVDETVEYLFGFE